VLGWDYHGQTDWNLVQTQRRLVTKWKGDMTLTTGQIGLANLNEKSETSIGETEMVAGVPSSPAQRDSGGDMQNDEEKQDGRDIALAPPSSPKITKPTKKSTVVELRQGLEALGLDIVGKKESLYKYASFLSVRPDYPRGD
jgi:hypothetical protein